MIAALSGCYLPTRFVAEITIQRTGDYTLTYDGVLLSSNLVPGLMTGEPDQREIDERLAGVLSDLGRDSSYQTVEYLGNGAFQVYFEKSDNIFERTSVTFIRTDNRFLSIAFYSMCAGPERSQFAHRSFRKTSAQGWRPSAIQWRENSASPQTPGSSTTTPPASSRPRTARSHIYG